MWIIDAETDHPVAITGGLNIANEYFRVTPEKPKKFWRDQDVIVKGESVRDMAAAFDRTFSSIANEKKTQWINFDWTWEQWNEFLDLFKIRWDLRSKLNPNLVKRVRKMAEKKLELKFYPAKTRFFQSQTRLGESYISQAYLKLIEDSKEILIANAYVIPSKPLIKALRDAVWRGTRVVLLTNSPETNDLPEITITGRDYYRDILSINNDPYVKRMIEEARKKGRKIGAEIWEWQGELEKGKGTIHAKYAVFDREVCLVGSHNLDPRSELHNSESAIVFRSKELGRYLAKRFFENDLGFSKKISMKEAEKFHAPDEVLYKIRKILVKPAENLL